MKKFFAEFKTFITRGNVVDMAVGVTVGSAFTAIVNAMTNNILKPIINWVLALILGEDSLSNVYTFLKQVTVDVTDELGNVTQQVDLANSIYIDWGAFLTAIINFLLIAIVLFTIVKVFNSVRDQQNKIADTIKSGRLSKAERKEMKAQGLNVHSIDDIKSYREQKAAEAAEAAEKAAAEKAAADAAAQAEAEKAAYAAAATERQEALLREIVELLKNK